MGRRVFWNGWVTIMLLLCGASVNALHIKGGWIFYRYVGQATNGELLYQVTVKVYRDCATPNPGQNDPNINVTAFLQGSGNVFRDFNAPLVSTYRLQKSSFSSCISPVPSVCYVILQYETQISLPASAVGYSLSFQRCCRINGIVNIAQPSNSTGNTYTITIPGNTVNSDFPKNNSPVFNEKDTVVVCYNSAIELDYGANDPDGDSLSYYFTSALNGASQANPNPTSADPPPYPSLSYVNPFSPADPFGTGLLINAQTGLITGRSPSITGEYVVAVGVDEFRNGVRIATTRKELHVNVANCSLAAADLPVRISACDDFTVGFENLSSSPAITSYFWDFGVPGISADTSNQPRPSFTYPDTGVFRVKLVVNKGSSCADSATTQVSVFPGFNPGFVVNGACYLNPFQFTDTTNARYGNANSWFWNFGDPNTTADTSRLRNPQYTYPSPGTYTPYLIVSSTKGCVDTFNLQQVVVRVDVLDRPALSLAFKDTLICSIDSLRLQAIGSGNFTWTPTTRMINSNTATPTVFPLDTTSYEVTLNDRGCVAKDTVTVNVLDFITVDAGRDTVICRGDGFTLRPVTKGLSFSWSPPSILNDASIRNPVATPVDSITTIQVTANLGKCQDVDFLTVRTVPYPQVNAGRDTAICFGTSAQLRGSIVGSRFTWSPTTGLASPASLSTVARPTQTTTYTLTVTDTLGCPKPVSDDVQVTVRPEIKVFAGNDTTVVYGQVLQFNGTSNAPIFQWDPPIALSNTNIADPTAVYTNGTLPAGQSSITYTLSSSTSEGCTGSDQVTVKVFSTAPSIFVPSGFTPNADGLNDVIRPVLAGVQKLEYFRVYNRYGQLVFETREAGRGWDGRIKGLLQASSAFVYQAQAIDYLGNVLRQSGTFVLIR